MDQGKGAGRQGQELTGFDPASRAGQAVRIGSASVRTADDQPTFWARVEAGTWEPGTVSVLDRLLGPGTVFVDLGAWVGPLSLLAAARGASVVAVEADPRALDQLRRNLAANAGLAGRVTVVDRAVSPVAGTVRLGARRKPGDSMSSVLLSGSSQSWGAAATTPADLAATLPPDLRRVVKLDIEGGEYALLPALGPLLAPPGTALLVSFHPLILAETGEPDPTGRALAAIATLPTGSASRVTEGGLVPECPSRESLAACETWLFVTA